MEEHRIPEETWIETERTDKIGTCLTDGNGHFFRQDKDKVLHVYDGVVNTLDENHLENSRKNFGDKFKKISKEEFNIYLQIQLNKFFD